MSLVDRSDYDALVRASDQMVVYEREVDREQPAPRHPGHGCFSCDHSVGSMSSEKKYTSVWFVPYVGDHNFISEAHLMNGMPPHPRFAVVISPEDKFYAETYHWMNDKVQSWDPPTSILTTRISLLEVVNKDMYVRQLVEFDGETGEPGMVRHVNRRFNLVEEFVEGYDDAYPGQFTVMSTSSYIRGSYVDLACDFGIEGGNSLDDPLFGVTDMRMTSDGWKRIKQVIPGLGVRSRGPRLNKLNRDPLKKKAKKIKPEVGLVTDASTLINETTNYWLTDEVDPTGQDDA